MNYYDYKQLGRFYIRLDLSTIHERLDNYLGESPFFGHGQSGVSNDSEDLILDVLWDGIVYFLIP